MLVVGAGPAGCAAAITMARAGARVCVVDRARFPRPKVCGDAVSNAAIEILEDLGASLRGVPHAVVARAVAVLPDGARIERDYGDRPGAIVTRDVLDELLVRALPDDVRLLEGTAVRALTSERGRVVGAATDAGELRARVVIAADGPGSVAWRALGKGPPRGRGLAVAATVYMEHAAPEPPDSSEHYFEHELPAGYGWAFPAVDGVSNVGVYQRLDAYRRGGDKLAAQLEAFLARHAQRFVGATRVGRVRAWQLPLASAGITPAGPGVLCAGDAGRLVDPLTGEGIWHALESGRVAGVHALRALDSGLGLDAKAARRYQRDVAVRVGVPAAARIGIQAAMDGIVKTRAYRLGWVQRALSAGYGSNSLEISKRVAG